jgi:hypothetical protein
MRCFRTILLLATATTLASCSGTGLDAARDLTGTWEGSGPTGASYTDNVANPNCAYEADIRIVFVQDGTSLTGSFTLTVTSSTKLLSTNLSCVPVGASNNEALFGSVNSSNVTFELFNTRTDFDGTFTTDILDASFASTLPGGIAGTMRVTRQ